MKILRIGPDSTRDDITEAIGHMRVKMQACEDLTDYAECEAALNDLLEHWATWSAEGE